VACTNAEEEHGAVLVFDAQTGSLRSVATHQGYVGWSGRGLLRWHPDGRRIATNVDTNGIALLDATTWVGFAYPDEGRDHGVRYVWIDERMYTDTKNLFEIEPGDARFEFETLDDAPGLSAIAWNANIAAVVGRVRTGVAAYDPIRRAVVYENDLAEHGGSGTASWSPDGRWCVRRQYAVHPASDELLFIDGDTGEVHGTRTPSSPRVDELVWGPKGALAVRSYVHHIGGSRSDLRIDLFFAGERRRTLDLGARRVEASRDLAEVSGMAWSPNQDGLALLLDGQEVRVYDAHSGAVLSSFSAPAPAVPSGLPDWYTHAHLPDFGRTGDLLWLEQHRLVRIAGHFVSVWTIDGQKLAEFVVGP
jgi:WD40 repeat protein